MRNVPNLDLAAENARLRTLISDASAQFPHTWRLTPTEESVFRVLLAHDVPGVNLIVASTGSTEKGVAVHIHRIRGKLTSKGVEIQTINGRGWHLVGRDHWRAILARPNEGVQ